MEFKKIAVIGLGMIGGSVAIAVRKNIRGAEITGIDPDSSTLSFGLKNRFIDKGIKPSGNLDFISECGAIVIATPVDIIAKTALSILPLVSNNAFITDTGSVKVNIIREIEKKNKRNSQFIGSHPLAGIENSGITAASDGIIKNKKVIITPTPSTSAKTLASVKKFWSRIGMKPVVISPAEHDILLATTSHLPHVLAYMLMNTISTAKGSIDPLTFTGSGFRDFTRIAKSDPELWLRIVLANRKHILNAISKFEKKFSKIKKAIERSDAKYIKDEFQQARELRRKLK